MDNGSTYKMITDRTPNNGQYEWLVPSKVSKSCLIRITDADKPILCQNHILFEFNMRIPRPLKLLSTPPGITALLSVPDPRLQAFLSLELQLLPYEAKKLIQISGNGVWTKSFYYEAFLERWHKVKR